MGATQNKLSLPAELVTDIFKKTAGHSALAKLCGASPIAFNGNTVMTFSLDGEAALVGEASAKPAGTATWTPVSIAPVKFVYQHRVSDEFVRGNDEARLPYLQAYADGFAKKIARALDIAALHGLNPATDTSVTGIAAKSFDTLVTNSVTYAAATVDENIEDAIQLIRAVDGEVNGIAFAPAAATALSKVKANGISQYPEFKFGANPTAFAGMGCDVNSTVSFGTATKDKIIVGDFKNAFRWGYSADIPLEVIEYGDPDNQGDLKRMNQVVIRSEAYIGWGILSADRFARVAST